MRRPFFVALEETSEDFVPSTPAEPVEETEAISAAEEVAADQAAIDGDSADIDEALEEAEALQEQVEVNEAKLEAAPEEDAAASGVEGGVVEEGPVDGVSNAITEEDVIVSEESLRYSMAIFRDSVGLEKSVKLSLENRKYMTRKQRLQVSTEEIKDFIARLIQSIKNMIKKLIANIKKIYSKVVLYIANYEKSIKENVAKLKKVKIENIDADQLTDKIAGIKAVELIALANGTVVTQFIDGWFSPLQGLGSVKEPRKFIKSIAKKNIESNNSSFYKSYGIEKLEDENDYICLASGSTALVLHKDKEDEDSGSGILKKISVTLDEESLGNNKINPSKFIAALIDNSDAAISNAKKSKVFFSAYDKFLNTNLKDVEQKEKNAKKENDNELRLKLKQDKSFAIDVSGMMLLMYMNGIKVFNRAINAVLAVQNTAEKKKSDKE